MRTLIDGYNLMYALGRLGQRVGPNVLRNARNRFLNDLAEMLGPIEAHLTTVVFDASKPPFDVPAQAVHKGISIIFAVNDESADDRIAALLAAHSTPKKLTVVSSDNGVRQAASRRRARALASEEFWSLLEERKNRAVGQPAPAADPEAVRRGAPVSSQESTYWVNEFRDVENEPGVREGLSSDPSLLTDAEIAAIEREVARELTPEKKRRPGSKRPER